MEVRVYYEDTDAGGVVYYANYLKYFERGRTEFLRDLGFEQDILLQQNIVFAVKHVEVAYQRPARFNDMLRVETRIEKAGKVSIDFIQTVAKEKEVLSSAKIKVVCLQADTFKVTAIPEEIRIQLKEIDASA